LSSKELTASRLRQLLSYNPDTGLFTRLITRPGTAGKARAGSVAGTTQSAGYIQICIDGEKYLAHRLAFLYMRGSFPRGNVDHANHAPNDNRFGNLRSGSQSQNCANSRLPCTSTTGKKGVYYRPDYGNWLAMICKDGKKIYLGLFDSAEAAQQAYLKAARRLFGEFAFAG
jgi:HNH endonuclease/AP2 domain